MDVDAAVVVIVDVIDGRNSSPRVPILRIRGLLEEPRYAKGIGLLERIVAMLTKLCD